MTQPPKNSHPVTLLPGERVGAYRIERKLGSGGMADVYYGVHEELRRPAAIKVLRPSLATDEVHLQRFTQEARAAASLIHPNIVQVYDVGQDGALRYIAQEYVAGSNLRQYLTDHSDDVAATNDSAAKSDGAFSKTSPLKPTVSGAQAQSGSLSTGDLDSQATPAESSSESVSSPNSSNASSSKSSATAGNFNRSSPTKYRQLEIRETLSILLQVLAALNKSASQSIVHRDIKPENIMLTQEGDVKVADFGLARILLGDDPQLTRAGTTLGTPMYMSPEQIQEGEVDIRSDLYSLGVTLFHMLCGRPPFTGETPLALAMQHVQGAIPEVSTYRSDAPESLQRLVRNLLAKTPNERFRTPAEVLEFLRENRVSDLAGVWPDHTIPLPEVRAASGDGPMQATMSLQSVLGKKRPSLTRRLLAAAAVFVFVGCFALGASLGYSSPESIFSNNSELYGGIEKAESVEEQYRLALLDGNNNRLAKWEAVEEYFPKRASPLNRLYVGLANLQIARHHRELVDLRKAQAALNSVQNDPEMPVVVRAVALLQIASIESEQGNNQEANRDIAIAKQLCTANSLSAKDLDQVDEAARSLPQSMQSLWFGS